MQASDALERFLLSLTGVASPATVDWYRRRLSSLVEFLGDVEVERVPVHDLRRWRVSLCERTSKYCDHPLRPEKEGGLSQYTLHGYVRAARRWFKWLKDEGVAEVNPAQRLELPKLPKGGRKGLSQLDMQRILDVARDRGIPRDYALVTFLADTMCRVGGLVDLHVDDLDLERGRATVHEKGDKERPVYLEQRAINALRAWLMVRPDADDDHVFLNRYKKPLTTNGAYQVLKRLAKAAGVTVKWNPHSWRHGGARAMLKRGVSLGVVSQFLGHESVQVTKDFYNDLDDEEL